MRSLKLSLVITGLLLGSLSWAKGEEADSSFVLNLEQCIDYALKNRESIQNAILETENAKYQVRETFGMGLPNINGDVSYTNDFAIRVVPLPAQFFAEDPNSVPEDAPPVYVRFGVPHSASVGIQVSQLIFDGSYLVGLQAANVYQELSQKEVVREKVATVEAVSKAFYTVLINKERMELINQSLQQLDTLLRETSAMYENGFAEQIDVDRIKVRYNNARTEQKNMNRNIYLSHQLLKFQMGMPLDHEIEINGNLDNLSLDNLNVDSQIKEFDPDQRIEFSLLETQVKLASLNLKNMRVANYPSLYGNLGTGYNSGTNTFSELTNFSKNWFAYGNFGFTLSVPIFGGTQRHYRAQQAKVQVLQRQNDISALRKSISLEIAQANVQLRSSLDALESEKENMELAQNIYRVTKIKYQEGIGSNLEVVEAETTYKEAETNYYQALYNALVAKIDLEKALGILVKQ